MQHESPTDVAQIPGLQQLWAQTLGDPRICIAVLDGPVDLSHPVFRGAALSQVSVGDVNQSSRVVSDHGTHVASIIFGQHHSRVKGIAPRCRGLIVPIFDYAQDGSLKPSSQERLAQAIRTALHYGANIINISGGQFTSDGQASDDLMAAVAQCEGKAIIIAAAGNDGCNCLHLPGALPSVLAVGAMNVQGEPLPFSNWGEAYREQGVLAPGEQILGASLDGRVARYTGTSFATPIVSGIAGLALSAVIQSEQIPRPSVLRGAILQSAIDCKIQPTSDCSKLLSGRLNVSGVVKALQRGSHEMHEMTYSEAADVSVLAVSTPSQVEASGCGCGCSGKSQPVYAIGEIDYDFLSLSRLNSLQQTMATLSSTRQQLSVQNRLDFARHLCGFEERQLEVASGLLSWNSGTPTVTVGGDTGFKLQVASGDDLIADDDYRRILIHGV
ncbi:MAG: S8 family serine peptidase, partial [Planctomycetia bacterium]|nr:S8 family serine peptidase [Planctomycetia bacterium]